MICGNNINNKKQTLEVRFLDHVSYPHQQRLGGPLISRHLDSSTNCMSGILFQLPFQLAPIPLYNINSDPPRPNDQRKQLFLVHSPQGLLIQQLTMALPNKAFGCCTYWTGFWATGQLTRRHYERLPLYYLFRSIESYVQI